MIKATTPGKLIKKHDSLSRDLFLTIEQIEATLELNGIPRPALIEDTYEILKEVSSSLDVLQLSLISQRKTLGLNSTKGDPYTALRIERLEAEITQNFKIFEDYMALLYRALGMVKHQSALISTSKAYVTELRKNITATTKALHKTLRDRGLE